MFKGYLLTNFYPSEFIEHALTEIAKKRLGWCGAMISGSKSGYREYYPANLAVFNANVCIIKRKWFRKKALKVWYGDIDCTKSIEKLAALSLDLGTTVYVLREMDARFENAAKPRMDNFVVKVFGTDVEIGPSESKYVELTKLEGVDVPVPTYKKDY